MASAAAALSTRQARRQAGWFAELRAEALTDGLTGLLNRRGFTQAAERELARARRYGRPFALAYVDVRGLKLVNDTEGHRAGDELLQAVARLLSECARADDAVGRLGGDEMGVLLVEHDDARAAAVLSRISDGVAARRADIGISAPWELTVGVASFPTDGLTVDALLEQADHRLYEQRGIELR